MKRDGLKFNRDNYTIQSDRMKIYIKRLGSQYWDHVVTQYNLPTGILTDDQKKEQQENNQALEAIISTLSDSEYVDVHGLDIAYKVWKKSMAVMSM